MKRGLLYALGAYGLWGFLPIYWKLLQTIPALEILSHRLIWSLGFLIILLVYTKNWQWLQWVKRDRRILLIFTVITLLLAVNWFTYIWAVNAGYIIETSLGYFINPLVNVLLGVLFLQEKLRVGQWLAIASAAIGVVYLTVQYGSLPWIALALAFSFGLYGFLKKTASLNALQGLSLETMLLFPVASVYLLYLEGAGLGDFGHSTLKTNLLLIFSGVITAVPLLCFGAAARRIPLSMLGIMQYIAPTIQILLGIYIYHEPFSTQRLFGFSFVWLALIIYTIENISHRRRMIAVANTQG